MFAKYTKDQLTSTLVEGSEHPVILSEFNDLGERFADPRTKQSFKYDHVRCEVSEIKPWDPDKAVESWRAALDLEWTKYCLEHYHEGAGSVFGSSKDDTITLSACIEGHQFQPKKFW